MPHELHKGGERQKRSMRRLALRPPGILRSLEDMLALLIENPDETEVRIPVIANNDSGSKRTRFRSKPNRCRLAAPVVAVRLSSGPAGGQAT